MAGCGGESADPIVEPAPETVGTLSEQTASEAIVQDVTAIREAMESAGADEAMTGIYDLINRAAAEAEVEVGASMLRDELPSLAAALLSDAKRVRTQVSALELQTESAEAFRDMALDLLADQVRLSQVFDADIATSGSAWGAVVTFGEGTNALADEYGEQLERIRNELPPDQRDALDEAARQLFGG